MKSKLFILILMMFALFVGNAWAGPFLVCDPQTGIATYEVEIKLGTGTPSVQTGIPAQADGSLKLDLVSLTQSGNYTFRAKSCNAEWGCSEWSSPFSATKPGSPGNVRIIP